MQYLNQLRPYWHMPVIALLICLGACQSDTAVLSVSDVMLDFNRAQEWIEPLRRLGNDEPLNAEEYQSFDENGFINADSQPLSTFGVDVDAASYSNVRRFIQSYELPPRDAVRIEELINYFTYDYPQPGGKKPFSVTTEISECPWNPAHHLVHIGLQGKEIKTQKAPPSNLVFLIDVSGSMRSPERLPLLKKSFRLLVNNLRAEDLVSLVVYAGAAGLVLPPTAGDQKETILAALDQLEAGGSTAGGEGLRLAYRVAQENLLPEGNNRIILATDGDFNVGVATNEGLVHLIEEKRSEGVFLTVLGVGKGNLKDARMEAIADHGNGNYYYLDSEAEAQKVLVKEIGATLHTIAKDVKIQVEFNPTRVKSYRLVGYENRLLRNEDFRDDSKDAGDIGAGHSVTALYEVEFVKETPAAEPQKPASGQAAANNKDERKSFESILKQKPFTRQELMVLKLRYKEPKESVSQELVQSLNHNRIKPLSRTSDNFRFAAAVASYGMLLRDSPHKGNASFDDIIAQAEKAKSNDPEGYRNEFIELVKIAREISGYPVVARE